MWRDLQFASNEYAYLLALIPLLWLLLWRDHRVRQKLRAQMVGLALRQRLLWLMSPQWTRLQGILVTICFGGLVLGLMQPRGNVRYASGEVPERSEEPRVLKEDRQEASENAPLQRRRMAHQVLFLLDASASMSVKDTRVGKSRLEYAKELIEEVVSRLEGQSVAVYAFTSEVSTVVPLTMDYLYARLMSRRIDINEGDVAGTDFVEALEFMKQRHWSDGQGADVKTLILLSDGGDTRLEASKGEDRRLEQEAILAQIGEAGEKNLRVFTVGLGTQSGAEIPGLEFEGQPVRSNLDEELLKRLSQTGRGRYYFANDFSALDIATDMVSILSKDDQWIEEEAEAPSVRLERVVEEEGEQNLIFDEYFQVPTFLAAVALALYLWFPRGRQQHKEVA